MFTLYPTFPLDNVPVMCSKGINVILRIAPAESGGRFSFLRQTRQAEGASRGKASHADQATALAALTRNPRAKHTEVAMLDYLRDIPGHDRAEWMGWAVLLTLAILNCLR